MKPTLTALFCLLAASCTQTHKLLTIETVPKGATILVNGKKIDALTPIQTEIEQRKDVSIIARKKGYELASKDLKTKTSTWLSIVWTKDDPKCKYIEEDTVKLTLKKIPTLSTYKPSTLSPYNPPSKGNSAPPPLRDMPAGF